MASGNAGPVRGLGKYGGKPLFYFFSGMKPGLSNFRQQPAYDQHQALARPARALRRIARWLSSSQFLAVKKPPLQQARHRQGRGFLDQPGGLLHAEIGPPGRARARCRRCPWPRAAVDDLGRASTASSRVGSV